MFTKSVIEQHFLFLTFASFAVGSAMGSFICAMVDRKLRGLSILRPGSHCVSCGSPLKWHDLVPFKVWIFDRGKCTACGIKIPAETLAMEAVGGAAYSAIPFLLDRPAFCAGYVVLVSFLLYMALMDIKTLEIPFPAVVLLTVSGLLLATTEGKLSVAAEGAVLALLVFGAIWFLAKNRFGAGDVFLFAAIGTFTGPVGLSPVVILASAWGIFYFAIKTAGASSCAENLKIEPFLPFAPFLGAAGAVVYALGL